MRMSVGVGIMGSNLKSPKGALGTLAYDGTLASVVACLEGNNHLQVCTHLLQIREKKRGKIGKRDTKNEKRSVARGKRRGERSDGMERIVRRKRNVN